MSVMSFLKVEPFLAGNAIYLTEDQQFKIFSAAVDVDESCVLRTVLDLKAETPAAVVFRDCLKKFWSGPLVGRGEEDLDEHKIHWQTARILRQVHASENPELLEKMKPIQALFASSADLALSAATPQFLMTDANYVLRRIETNLRRYVGDVSAFEEELSFIDESLRANKDFILRLRGLGINALKYAHPDLLADLLFRVDCLKKARDNHAGCFREDADFINNDLRSNFGFLNYLADKGINPFRYACLEFRRDPEFILYFLQRGCRIGRLFELDRNLIDNKDFLDQVIALEPKLARYL